MKVYGTGIGEMKKGVEYNIHPNLLEKLVKNGFCTEEKEEVKPIEVNEEVKTEEKEEVKQIKKVKKNEKVSNTIN